jgi:hypothetical protein
MGMGKGRECRYVRGGRMDREGIGDGRAYMDG